MDDTALDDSACFAFTWTHYCSCRVGTAGEVTGRVKPPPTRRAGTHSPWFLFIRQVLACSSLLTAEGPTSQPIFHVLLAGGFKLSPSATSVSSATPRLRTLPFLDIVYNIHNPTSSLLSYLCWREYVCLAFAGFRSSCRTHSTKRHDACSLGRGPLRVFLGEQRPGTRGDHAGDTERLDGLVGGGRAHGLYRIPVEATCPSCAFLCL